jgi:DNA ligase (NAD+)
LLARTIRITRHNPGAGANMASSPAQRIGKLREEIDHHNYLYFVENKPSISDQAYDRLMHELIELEEAHPDLRTADSPTQRVGGELIKAFGSVRHAVPMMSIDNTYDEAEVRAFDERVRKAIGEQPTYVLEPKVDGVAISLRYEDGALITAATRGDGRTGDDVTPNIRTVRSVPLRLRGKTPRVIEVRGEVFMNNDVFQKINQERLASGEEAFANPRNFTAGTLKQLDPKITASRKLRFVSHGVGQVQPALAESYSELLGALKEFGLPVTEHISHVKNIDDAISTIEKFAKLRGKLAYQTDGMVVKVDRFDQREKLGATSKAPRWVIAFKYPAEQMPTVVNDIWWSVGKTGALTPVATLEPVFIAGTTVRNAGLHNIEQIEAKDIRVGDTVIVEKAGEIIPQVVEVVLKKRPKNSHKVVPPSKCPSCGAPVHKDEDSPYIHCTNPACPAQLKERLRWFAARGQMDIENLGDVLVDHLVEAGKLKTFADIYRLKKEDLLALERMGEKSAANVLESIKGSRSRSLERLLGGLGIRHVGGRVATVLAANMRSLDALMEADEGRLESINEIGPVIAKSVHEFFASKSGRAAVAALKDVGIDPEPETPEPGKGGGPLAEMTVVVTGTLEHYSREEIEALITKLGGRAAGSVSKKTSFVVAGADAGSKLDKAKKLGVRVISEDEFREKIKQ